MAQPRPTLKPVHITTRSPSPAPPTPAAAAAAAAAASPVAAAAATSTAVASSASAAAATAASAPATGSKSVVRRFFATKQCTKAAPLMAPQSEVHSWTGASTIVTDDGLDPRAPQDPMAPDRSCEACGNDVDEILITCKMCRVRVHPSCVGVNPDRLPGQGRKGCEIVPFTCLPCSRGLQPECELCGLKGGPLKPTERNTWGHIPCAWQIPELWFNNAERLDVICGFDFVPKAATQRTCSICSNKSGICVQCYAMRKGKRCTNTFHVGCAKRDPKYRVEMIYAQSILGIEGEWDVAKVCFCSDHFDAVFNEAQWASEQRRGMELEKSDPKGYWDKVKTGTVGEATKAGSKQKKKAGSKKKGGAKDAPATAAAAAPADSAAKSSKRKRSEPASAAAAASSTPSKSPIDLTETSPAPTAVSTASRKKGRATMNSMQTAAEVAAAEAAAAAALAESDSEEEDEDEEEGEDASSAAYLARLQHTSTVIHSADMLDDGWGESTQLTTAAASSSSSSAAAAASGGFESNLHKLFPLHPPSLSASRSRSTGSEFDTLAFVARQELSPRVQQLQQDSSRAVSPSLGERTLGSPLMMRRAHAGGGEFVTPMRADPSHSLSHSLASSSDKSALASPPSHLSTPSWFNESFSKQTPPQQQHTSSDHTPSSLHSTSLSSGLQSLGASFAADSPAQLSTPSAAAAAAVGRGLLLSPILDSSMIGASGEAAEEASSHK